MDGNDTNKPADLIVQPSLAARVVAPLIRRWRKHKIAGMRRENLTYAIVFMPKNCTSRNLSVNALDSRSRELAWQTIVTVEGKILPCISAKEKTDAAGRRTLVLEVEPGYYAFQEMPEEQQEAKNANSSLS
jgi:hypothetical protein